MIVRTKTVYEKPPARWLEPAPIPYFVGETNRALYMHNRALMMTIGISHADKKALREWADGLPDEPLIEEEEQSGVEE